MCSFLLSASIPLSIRPLNVAIIMTCSYLAACFFLSVISMLPWIIYPHHLHCFTLAARTFIDINTELFYQSHLYRDHYTFFMQGQLHIFKYVVNALLPVPVGKVTVGSYLGKTPGKNMLLKAADEFWSA